jgi:glycogen operon protein
MPVIAWFTPAGAEMTKPHWDNADLRSFGLYLDDEAGDVTGHRPKTLDRFYVLLNAALEPVSFTLPSLRWGALWVPLLDTADDRVGQSEIVTEAHASRTQLVRPPQSLLMLRGPRRRRDPGGG